MASFMSLNLKARGPEHLVRELQEVIRNHVEAHLEEWQERKTESAEYCLTTRVFDDPEARLFSSAAGWYGWKPSDED